MGCDAHGYRPAGEAAALLAQDREPSPVRPKPIFIGSCRFAFYLLLVVWLTWPLAADPARRLPATTSPCNYDNLHIGWAMAWQCHAVATPGASLGQANIYHPTDNALFYGPPGLGGLLLFGPIYALSGNPTLALNGLFLLANALTAWAVHTVLRRWTTSSVAGFLGAFAYLTSRWVLWKFLPSAPHYTVLWWFPFLIDAAARAEGRLRDAARVGVLTALQCLADPVYVAAAVLGPLGLLTAGRLVRRATRPSGFALLGGLALAAALLWPVYLPYLAVRAANPELATQSYWAHPIFLEAVRLRLPLGFLAETRPTSFAPLLLLPIGLGLFSAWRARVVPPEPVRRGLAHALLWTSVGLALSVTPSVVWDGRDLALPHAVLWRWFPFLENLRAQERPSVAALFGICLLVGLAYRVLAAEIERVCRGGVRAAVVTAALVVAITGGTWLQYSRGIGLPEALARRPLPPAYPTRIAIGPDAPLLAQIRAGEGPLLELPVIGLFDDFMPDFHAAAMYRSIQHWRPLLNGYASYWPADWPERMRTADRLPDPAALRTLVRETGLRTILVHCNFLLRQGWCAEWRDLAARGGDERLRFVAAADDDLLFEIRADG